MMVDYTGVKSVFEMVIQKKNFTLPRDRMKIRIVSGGCTKGGDRFAEMIAKYYGLSILIYYPDWNGDGKAAGFIRNTFIAKRCDVLIACVVKNGKGGTEDTIDKATRLGKQIYIYK